MLNKDNVRELAYVVAIDNIEPIVGSDNCEAAVVGGWRIMVRKDTFKPGDLAVYFEIDSKVPETETFAFLEKKHYKVKTQRYTFGGKGNFISQGLLMHPSDFGWKLATIEGKNVIQKADGTSFLEGDFLTTELGVTYADTEDNTRKAASADKYKKMAQRRPNLFKKKWARWMMKRSWGRKVMFFFFGKKKDVKTAWPQWVVKTDEERIENLPHYFADKTPLVATEKVDGTSTTFTMKRGKFGKVELYICSRNVVFDTPDKRCYYDTNVYVEMAEKYQIADKLKELLDSHPDAEWVTIQGETFGGNIQKRDYSTTEHDFKAFNLIFSNTGRLGTVEMEAILTPMGIPCVPIISTEFIMPDTIDELRAFVDSAPSAIDGKMKEGIVFRALDGTRSFKCVSPTFLMKYHN